MSDAGLSANASRGVKFGSEPASGLNDGDVVAFLDPDSGKPYAVRREEGRVRRVPPKALPVRAEDQELSVLG